MIRLKAVEHDHVGPEVILPLGALDRGGGSLASWAEEAVIALAVDGAVDPDSGLLDLLVVVEQVGTIAKALEPVGDLFPAALAITCGAEPGVLVRLEEVADLGQMAVEAGGLELELLAQPSF